MDDFRNQRVTLKSQAKKIIRNRCQCTVCGSIIESKSVHDFVQCACGRVFTDGGVDYIHRGFQDQNDLKDLTEFEQLPLDKPNKRV